MISREPKEIPGPQTKRHFCVRIVRANDVKNDEKRDENIGDIGKPEVAMCQRKREHKEHEQHILQKPCLSIQRMNCRENPEDSAKREQARNEFVLSAH